MVEDERELADKEVVPNEKAEVRRRSGLFSWTAFCVCRLAADHIGGMLVAACNVTPSAASEQP
jgi:hypothetical protein